VSVRDVSRRHLWLIALYQTRFSIRGGAGLLFFLLVFAVGLIVASVAMLPLEQAEYEVRRAGRPPEAATRLFRERVQMSVPLVSAFLGERQWSELGDKGEDRWASWLLLERPTLLSQVLLVMLFALPLLAVLGGFNQYAGDVASRGIRFQLLRTERANLYFGRFLGATAYAGLTLAFLLLTVVAFFALRVELYSWGELMAWGARGLLALLLLLLPYLAFTGLFSATVDSPFGALVVSSLPIVGVPIVALFAGMKWEWAAHVKWLLPWGFQSSLLHPDPARFLLAAFGCLAYTALYLAAGYRLFSRRDL
jgi:hypothetical protein